jgi:hypothetical protein
LRKENAPELSGGVLTVETIVAWPSSELLLRWLCSWRRSGWFRCSRLGSRWRRSRLNGVLLIIEANDVLRNINLIGGVQDWRILAGSIQNHAETVLARVAIQNVYHLAADALEHFLLRSSGVFLKIIAAAIEALGKTLALGREARFFLLAELSLARLELLLQIIDLLRQRVDF